MASCCGAEELECEEARAGGRFDCGKYEDDEDEDEAEDEDDDDDEAPQAADLCRGKIDD